MIDIEINRNKTECLGHKQKSENALHEIFLAMDMVKEMLSHMNPSVIFDLEKYHPAAFKKFNDHKNKFMYAIIRENLELGKKEGLYREDIQTDILARYRLVSMFIIFNHDMFPLGKHSLANLIEEITDNFIHGIATAKGQKLIQKYKQQRLNTETV